MRTLIVLRGAPGAGKSTWVKNHNLEKYTISPDAIRLLCQSPRLTVDGDLRITQKVETENVVWDVLLKMLEYRMKNGEFTVLDATASSVSDINQYKNLCEKYKYRMFIVDFSKVPLETCLKQNKERASEKWVNEADVTRIYNKIQLQNIPSGITVLDPTSYSFYDTPLDLSQYEKIIHIGDIHGCYSTLMSYLKNGLNDNYCYIFCGDYLDRGNENDEVLKFIQSIAHKENVCLLEGNHERWINNYGRDTFLSPEFKDNTLPTLTEFSKKDARQLYRKFRQCSHYLYNGIEVLACHGGISTLNTNLAFISAEELIHGTGTYHDHIDVALNWMQNTKENQFLVHGSKFACAC